MIGIGVTLKDVERALSNWLPSYHVIYPNELGLTPDTEAVFIRMIYLDRNKTKFFKTRTFDDGDREFNTRAALYDAYGIVYEIVWRETLRMQSESLGL